MYLNDLDDLELFNWLKNIFKKNIFKKNKIKRQNIKYPYRIITKEGIKRIYL